MMWPDSIVHTSQAALLSWVFGSSPTLSAIELYQSPPPTLRQAAAFAFEGQGCWAQSGLTPRSMALFPMQFFSFHQDHLVPIPLSSPCLGWGYSSMYFHTGSHSAAGCIVCHRPAQSKFLRAFLVQPQVLSARLGPVSLWFGLPGFDPLLFHCCTSIPVFPLFLAEEVQTFSRCMEMDVPSLVCFLHQSHRSAYCCCYSSCCPMVESLRSLP